MENENIWFVIYTKSRHEKNLAEQLLSNGFEIYLPLVKKLTQWSDRKKIVYEPLFKSYIFIKGHCDKSVFRDYKSFVGFVKYDNKPAKVWQREIDVLVNIIKNGYDVSDVSEVSELLIGNKVMIIQGPMKGLIGDLISIDNNQGFNINFENFNSSLMVKLPAKILKNI